MHPNFDKLETSSIPFFTFEQCWPLVLQTFGATFTVGLMEAPTGIVSDKKPSSLSSVLLSATISLASKPRNVHLHRNASSE